MNHAQIDILGEKIVDNFAGVVRGKDHHHGGAGKKGGGVMKKGNCSE